MQQAVRELCSLNERALKDIGITHGDIASIASGAVTVRRINQRRYALAVSRVRLVKETKPPTVKLLVHKSHLRRPYWIMLHRGLLAVTKFCLGNSYESKNDEWNGC
jgi:hypothetical protein